MAITYDDNLASSTVPTGNSRRAIMGRACTSTTAARSAAISACTRRCQMGSTSAAATSRDTVVSSPTRATRNSASSGAFGSLGFISAKPAWPAIENTVCVCLPGAGSSTTSATKRGSAVQAVGSGVVSKTAR